MNDGKYWRAYTTAFKVGKDIPSGKKNAYFDINIASLGFLTVPAVFFATPCSHKLTNIRYIFDESTAQSARIAFDNDDATLAPESFVRLSIIIAQ